MVKTVPGVLERSEQGTALVLPAVMVVFLGRHLPVLLGLFKKKGEWVWLGMGRGGTLTPPFTRPFCKKGDQGRGRVMGGGWGAVMRPDRPAFQCAFVQRLFHCLCLVPACLGLGRWIQVSLTLKPAAVG